MNSVARPLSFAMEHFIVRPNICRRKPFTYMHWKLKQQCQKIAVLTTGANPTQSSCVVCNKWQTKVDLHISVLKFLSESDHSQWHKQVNSSYDVHVKGLTTSFALDKVISWQWDMNNLYSNLSLRGTNITFLHTISPESNIKVMWIKGIDHKLKKLVIVNQILTFSA